MEEKLGHHLIQSSISILQKIKDRAEKSFNQVTEFEQFHWLPDNDSNSLSILIRHFSGNMKSRWSEIFTTDGEKATRKRDEEFDETIHLTKDELMSEWNEAWSLTFNTFNAFTPEDLMRTIYIRSEPHTLLEAIMRQLDHYSAHLGQIIFIAKLLTRDQWKSLTIPKKRK